MNIEKYFLSPKNIYQKQYEAIRAFYIEKLTANQVAEKFGYTKYTFYSIIRDFKKKFSREKDPFFSVPKLGRKEKDKTGDMTRLIILLRKKYLSVPDIKSILDTMGHEISEKYIYNVLRKDGFRRLPRRSMEEKSDTSSLVPLKAPKSVMLDFAPETFTSQNNLGINCLLPYIQKFGIDRLIENSEYPETSAMNRLSSIMSFIALKLSNVKRYSADDTWCMDRGPGLFAGLNVLPKAAWFTSYSHRITRKMNLHFLKGLHKIWIDNGFLSDTANIDFTTIPYWGDDSHLENNWSGTRGKAMASILAVIGQDPHSGIITYGDTNIRHKTKSKVILEFLDFYRENGKGKIEYLVFDSKFTTYENLARLDKNVKFITIRRRGKKIVEELAEIPPSDWKKIRVPSSDGKNRSLKVNESEIFLRGYGKNIRQIAITGHGKIKPAIIITNDFEKKIEIIIRKYARRWMVEKSISEQIEFFHLNKVSSSMVIKIDFDLTMSITAHNIMKLLANDLTGYSHCESNTLFDKFLRNSGSVIIKNKNIIVKLKKKRNMPLLLEALESFQNKNIGMLKNKPISFIVDTTS